MGRAQAAYSGAVALGATGATRDGDTAVSFDGATSVVVGPDDYSFGGNAPFTIEAWVAPAPGGLPVQRICNHRHGPPHTGWLLYVDSSKRAVFERWNGDTILGTVASALSVGAYSHVVVRYDGAELSMWINGQQSDHAADTGRIGDFRASLTWGAASTSVLDFFNGTLDEGAVYEYAIATDRIAAHYQAR
jgi:hypothetical protein